MYTKKQQQKKNQHGKSNRLLISH